MGVEHRGVHGVEGAVGPTERVVGDEDVQPSAERRGGGGDELAGGVGPGEVAGARVHGGGRVAERGAYGGGHLLGPVGAPGHGGVVRHVVVQVDARSVRGEPSGHGVADAAAPAGSGDEGGAAAQGQRVAAQVFGGGVGKSWHGHP